MTWLFKQIKTLLIPVELIVDLPTYWIGVVLSEYAQKYSLLVNINAFAPPFKWYNIFRCVEKRECKYLFLMIIKIVHIITIINIWMIVRCISIVVMSGCRKLDSYSRDKRKCESISIFVVIIVYLVAYKSGCNSIVIDIMMVLVG